MAETDEPSLPGGWDHLQRQRLDKARALRERGEDPYPAHVERTHTAADLIAGFATFGDQAVTATGRISGGIRDMGRSTFLHIEDGSGRIQLFAQRNRLGDDAYARFQRDVDSGDFVQATGTLMQTRTGEVTIALDRLSMLAKAINPPPEKYHGLTDLETRYRRRYLDLLANPEVRQVFVTRARIITAMRRFLDGQGFLEVETPTLQPLYGGAAARPFVTQHNALDRTLYLRIADELYLKRLLVGGFERVYEICKDFRNEGIDTQHNPEFTMMELYQAYADYRDIMALVEQMVVAIAQEVLGGLTLTYAGQAIDLTLPWRRLTLREAIQEATGIDYEAHPTADTLLTAARAAGADVPAGTVRPRIIDELLKTFVRRRLVQPTFLIDYPVDLSPLAKRKPDQPDTVERFQPFIGGLELGNAFSELNDPVDQLRRFQQQQTDRAAGDEEAMPLDEDFVTALLHGMPPTGGLGIGIDRLTMLFTDQPSIRDVILFPQLRS
ncbi:MAG: lysine--tRNA ligase [Chloroflexi bacterium]|nr:lysine--tRNA ligase [Chloroflexota bacterium]